MENEFWLDSKGNMASWPKQMLMLYFGRSWGDIPSLLREIGLFSYFLVGSQVAIYLLGHDIPAFLWFINTLILLHLSMCIYGFVGHRNIRANQYKYGYLKDLSRMLSANRKRDYEEYSRLRSKWSNPPSQSKCDALEIRYLEHKNKLSSDVVNIVESNRRVLFPNCSATREHMTLCRKDYITVKKALSEFGE